MSELFFLLPIWYFLCALGMDVIVGRGMPILFRAFNFLFWPLALPFYGLFLVAKFFIFYD